jgi:hypothetical protein
MPLAAVPAAQGDDMASDRTPSTPSVAAGFEMHFQSLLHEGHALAFPCDREGHVDLDAMSERVRNSYFFARALVGHDFTRPAVRPCARAPRPFRQRPSL